MTESFGRVVADRGETIVISTVDGERAVEVTIDPADGRVADRLAEICAEAIARPFASEQVHREGGR